MFDFYVDVTPWEGKRGIEAWQSHQQNVKLLEPLKSLDFA
jgi:hypothetical protein